jgi:hypothetical protein
MNPVKSENSEMFRPNSIIFLAIAAILAVAIACSSEAPTPTPPPPTATPVPSASPTPTPVPLKPIEIGPAADPVGFLSSLPESEAACAVDALGGRDRVLAMLESGVGSSKLTTAEADALDGCLSNETVQAVFIGQLSKDAGTLSDDTVACITDKTRGMSAAGLFMEQPATDSVISSLQGIFCLNHDERAALSTSASNYGFSEFGGIDSLECVVNGVGPTGLQDLLGIAGQSEMDVAALGDLFPLMIECGAIDDSTFEETGFTADQVGCVISEYGVDGLALLDPDSTAEPDLSQLGPLLLALGTCEIEIEGLLGGSALPVDPNPAADPKVLPTVQVEIPEEVEDLDLPFNEEQMECLVTELGEEAITKLLAGGAPDPSLFAAPATCDIDLATLLGG